MGYSMKLELTRVCVALYGWPEQTIPLSISARNQTKDFFGPEISPYPEVVRGRERELATGQQRGGTANRVGVEPRTGAVNTGLRRQ